MRRLTQAYPQLAESLRKVLSDEALSCLDGVSDDTSNSAMCAWLDKVDEESGYIEISGQFTWNGCPMTIQMAPDELALLRSKYASEEEAS